MITPDVFSLKDSFVLGDHSYHFTRILATRYAFGGEDALALRMETQTEYGWEPLTMITVNVEGDPRPGPKVWVGDYSENTGIIEELERQGLAKATGLTRPSGWVELTEVELTGELWAFIERQRAEA